VKYRHFRKQPLPSKIQLTSVQDRVEESEIKYPTPKGNEVLLLKSMEIVVNSKKSLF